VSPIAARATAIFLGVLTWSGPLVAAGVLFVRAARRSPTGSSRSVGLSGLAVIAFASVTCPLWFALPRADQASAGALDRTPRAVQSIALLVLFLAPLAAPVAVGVALLRSAPSYPDGSCHRALCAVLARVCFVLSAVPVVLYAFLVWVMLSFG